MPQRPIVAKVTASVLSMASLFFGSLTADGSVHYLHPMTDLNSPSVLSSTAIDYAASVAPIHPRILMTQDARADLVLRAASDAYSKKAYASVKSVADRALLLPTIGDTLSGANRLTDVSSDLSDRTYALAMSYTVSGDTRYAERLWRDLDAAAKFKDWSPEMFLATSSMTVSFAIAYDWLYDYWSVSQRAQLVAAIANLGLRPSLTFYSAPEVTDGSYSGNWVYYENNWNMVSNSAMILGALAIADREPSLSNEVLNAAMVSIDRGLEPIGDEGGFREGPAYWDYAMTYLAQALMGFRTAIGSDYGLSARTGLSKTGSFPLYVTSPAGNVFNFGDSNTTVLRPPSLLAFGQIYANPVYTFAGSQPSTSGNATLRLLWYAPAAARTDPRTAGMALDGRFDDAGVASFRSSWTDSLGTFLAFQTGTVGVGSHQDLDAGSFSLDTLGENWAIEYGRDDYSLPKYNDSSTSSARWTYFRKRAEGQNTLVFNPYSAQPTTVAGTGTISQYASNSGSAFAVVDLSSYYPTSVNSWRRGFRVFGDRREVVVQDEIVASASFEAIWSMHTRAHIEIAADGRTAILTQRGQTLVARISTPGSARFIDLPAAPLPNSSPPPGQAIDAAARRLAIQVSSAGNMTLAVQFSPLEPGTALAPLATTRALDLWKLDATPSSRLTGIGIAGVPLSGFTSGVRTYHALADPTAIPNITATAAAGATIDIQPPGQIPGVARITVTESMKTIATYRVFLDRGAITVASATAESTMSGRPSNTIDGNEYSYWSTSGDRWISWSRANSAPFRTASIAWRANSSKLTLFQIQTSPDGVSWTTVFDGEYRGASGTQDVVLPETVTAKNIRIVGHGDGANDKTTSINEIRFYTHDTSKVTPSVSPDSLQAVALTGIPTEMVLDQNATTGITAKDSTGTSINRDAINARFYSGDPALITIDPNGVITATGVGATTVWVQADLGGRGAFSELRISVVDVTRVRIYASSDTYVESGVQASTNFGSASTLLVKPPPANNPDGTSRLAFLSFDLSALKGGQVDLAMLAVSAAVQDSAGSRARLDIHSVVGPWSEATTTWTNKPQLGPTVGSVAVDLSAAYRSADVTEFVGSAVVANSKDAAFGIAQDTLVNGTSGLRVAVSSREAPARPYLDVTLRPEPLAVSQAVASTTISGGASSTVDGNESTYWRTSGDRWIRWTLAAAAPVKSIEVSWRANSSALTLFEVQTSTDGSAWTTQLTTSYSGPSAVQRLMLERAPRSKYVRFVVHGDGANDRTSTINEVRLYNYDRSAPPPVRPDPYLGSVAFVELPTSLDLGSTAPSSLEILDTTGRPMTATLTAAYSSSQPDVASVSTTGAITAVGVGTATITATVSFNGDTVTASGPIVVTDPTKMRIYAVKDAYVEGGGSGTTNFGSATYLLVKGSLNPSPDGAFVRESFAAFDLAPLAGKTIMSAQLVVYGAMIDASSARTRVDVWMADGSWSENMLTWTNRPAHSPAVASVVFDQNLQYRSTDITPAIQEEAGSLLSIGLSQDAPFDGTLSLRTKILSKESGSPPYIDVVIAP